MRTSMAFTPRARPFAVLALTLASHSACAANVGLGSLGDAASDAPVSPDAPDTSPDTCTTALDCASRPLPPNPYGTMDWPGWSCIVGRCSYERRGARTCTFRADGCIQCDTEAARHCPTAACNFGSSPTLSGYRMTGAMCMRPDFTSVAQCFGDFTRQNDGSICSLRFAPTGAPIVLLTCGACSTELL